jgi:hypothetical protein
MEADDVDKILFEQHWSHHRHIESERMWIMGFWLGVTAAMLKEIWLVKETTFSLTALRWTSAAHLFITVAVLLIIVRLQIAYDVHASRIKLMSQSASKKSYWWVGLGGLTRVPTLPLGFVCFILLCSGIFVDVGLMTSPCIQSRFPARFMNLALAAAIAISALLLSQLPIRSSNKKLKDQEGTHTSA